MAKASAASMTTSGSDTNAITFAAVEPGSARPPPTAVTSKSAAGSRAVMMLTAAPGSSDSGRAAVVRPASGRAGIPARNRANSGPAITSDGTAINRP